MRLNFISYAIMLIIVLTSELSGSNITDAVFVEGKITYLTIDQVYCDLGINDGINLGDTLIVRRDSEDIGLIIIANLANNSSIGNPIAPIGNFVRGDRVVAKIIKKSIIDQTKEITTTDSYQDTQVDQNKRLIIKHSGNLSLRYSYQKFENDIANNRSIGNLQYGLESNTVIPIKMWIYGRGSSVNKKFTLYQGRIEIGQQNGQYQLQLGRIFSSEMPGLGATDGIYLSDQFNSKIRAGFIGGFKPNPATLDFDKKIKKAGVFSEFKTQSKNFRFNILSSVIGQYSGKTIDREYLYFNSDGELFNSIRISLHQIFDFDRSNEIADRNFIEPTSTQVLLFLKINSAISFNARYSGIKPIIYQTTSIVYRDSLFQDALHQGWYSTLRLRGQKLGSIQIGMNFRQNSPSNKTNYYFISIQPKSIIKTLNQDVELNHISNSYLKGFRGKVGLNYFRNRTSIYTNFEYFDYNYNSFSKNSVEKVINVGFSIRANSSLSINTSLEYSLDATASYLFGYFSVSYRF
ncbi:hypothetical protein ACFL46_00975 [Candidatus Neomarinimicrobiota bacterium]